ncbi:hypothetical protein GCM10009558_007640 [Virgisporangium aurantiacum]
MALIAPHDPGGTSPPDAREMPPDAREILLAAAQHAAQQPTTTAKYWHVRKLSTGAPVKVGTESAPYYVVQRLIDESWMSHGPGERNWNGLLRLGYKPQTAADEEAWRAAGSPTSWKPLPVPTDGKPYSPDERLTSEPGKPELYGSPPRVPGAPRPPVLAGGMSLDWDEVSRLPTDPAALRTELLNQIRAGRISFPNPESRLFSSLSLLLLEAPAPPAVRAAAFTLLADVPGVRVVGEVTDAAGRTGTGIELRRDELRLLLIVDPSKHVLLASDQIMKLGPDSFDHSDVVLTAEWTDAEPKPPVAP